MVPIVVEAGDGNLDDVGGPQVGPDDGPVGDPAVSRDGVETEVAVHVVRAPPHLHTGEKYRDNTHHDNEQETLLLHLLASGK